MEEVPYVWGASGPGREGGRRAQDTFGAKRGWKPSKAAWTCVRWVRGLGCLVKRGRPCDGCEPFAVHRGYGVLDHSRAWTAAGARIMLGEPYDMASPGQLEALARLREACAGWDLEVTQRADLSVWYPPYTSMILVHPVGWEL